MICLFWITLHFFNTVFADDLPTIQIFSNGIPSFDFQNESVVVLTNSNPEFQMLCTASYPVEWIFHFSEDDDGNNEKNRLIETRRQVKDFLDVSSYSFSSSLTMEYKGQVLSPTNMTCQKVPNSDSIKSQAHLARHVIMTLPDQKSILSLEITSELLKSNYLSNSSIINENCLQAETLMEPPSSDYPMPCWRCQSPNDQQPLEIQFDYCYSPTICASIYRKQNHGKQCFKRVDEDLGKCKLTDADYNPMLILCRRFGAVLVHTFFFGVFRGDLNQTNISAPNIYMDWTEADPQDMLYIHPLEKHLFFTEEQVTFTCEYSRYYFALGSWFGFESESNMEYIPAVDIRPCDTEKESHMGYASQINCTLKDFWRGTYKASLSLKLEKTGVHRIFCFGPVFQVFDSLSKLFC